MDDSKNGKTWEFSMITKENIQEIILNELNNDSSSFIHLMDHDRKRLANIIAQSISRSIDDDNKTELELKRKSASDEILRKLENLDERGNYMIN